MGWERIAPPAKRSYSSPRAPLAMSVRRNKLSGTHFILLTVRPEPLPSWLGTVGGGVDLAVGTDVDYGYLRLSEGGGFQIARTGAKNLNRPLQLRLPMVPDIAEAASAPIPVSFDVEDGAVIVQIPPGLLLPSRRHSPIVDEPAAAAPTPAPVPKPAPTPPPKPAPAFPVRANLQTAPTSVVAKPVAKPAPYFPPKPAQAAKPLTDLERAQRDAKEQAKKREQLRRDNENKRPW